MALSLDILYRGPLSSCNYACSYCPFAKKKDSAETLARDAAQLERFVKHIAGRPDDRYRILFTPWGEALIRRHYRDAMLQLSRLGQVARVAAQTNLSGPLAWLADADRSRLALWCTYHRSQTSREAFLARCRRLDELGVRYSVGMVGLREDLDEIEAMRRALPEHVYLWINAVKREAGYYGAADLTRLERVDPLVALNAVAHVSEGRMCRAGSAAISVDGNGDVRRCHFVSEVIGNLYDPAFERALRRRACPNARCGCYIGYAHLEPLRLHAIYGDGLLERIAPAAMRTAGAAQAALRRLAMAPSG